MSHPRLTIVGLASLAFLLTLSVAWPTTRIQVAREVAEWRWGRVCNGQVTILNEPLRPPLWGWANDCSITITTRRRFAWWELCRLVSHEYGHVARFRARNPYVTPMGFTDRAHSASPLSVMFPYILEPWRPCGRDHNHPRFGR